MSLLKYRPDIDGLRALAVLAVIVFHFNANWLPGGFLGVDIFFVISGFLITSIIFPQIENGTFSFSDFYIRRIKRILPVFFVVLFTGIGLAFALMLSVNISDVMKSAIASVLFVANVFFARHKGGYFDVTSEEKPFLHLWSLSVEEQYYFIFPIFLFLLFRWFYIRKHILKIFVATLIFLLASSFFNLKKIGISWDVYYLSHLRFIEILVGSVLAVFVIKYPKKVSKRTSFALSVASLFIIVLSIISENIFTPPPFSWNIILNSCGRYSCFYFC